MGLYTLLYCGGWYVCFSQVGKWGGSFSELKRAGRRARSVLLFLDLKGEQHLKGCALSGHTRDGDISAHELAKPFTDGQAEACTSVIFLGLFVGLCVLREDFRTLLVTHPNARVLDEEGEPLFSILFLLGDSERDSTFFGKFTGVGEEVEQTLSELASIGAVF